MSRFLFKACSVRVFWLADNSYLILTIWHFGVIYWQIKGANMTDEEWMKNYIKLTKWLKNGYPDLNSKNKDEKALAEFVRSQREEYKQNKLPHYREKLLNDVHFCWCYDKVKHDENLSTWQTYEQNYIQKLVAANGSRFNKDGCYKTNKTKDWEQKQRKEEKLGCLDSDREYELKKTGFYFDDTATPKQQKKSTWFKNYNLLIKLLKVVNGDYDKVKTLEAFKDIEDWFYLQIKEGQNGALEDDRQYLLDNINFPFESIYKKD